MRKKTSFILLIILMLGVIGFFYINNIFIPFKLKNFLSKKASLLINRQIQVDNIKYDFIEGIVAENVKIFQKDSKNKIFFCADKISFRLILTNLFINKKVIIPSLTMRNPLIYAILNEDKSWNFSDLLTAPLQKNKEFEIYLSRLIIENGHLVYIDKTGPEIFTEEFTNMDFSASLGFNRTIAFKTELLIPRNKSSFFVQGSYDLEEKRIAAKTLGNNLFISKYLNAFSNPQLSKIKSAVISSFNGNLDYSKKALKYQGDIIVRDALLDFSDNLIVKGKINALQTSVLWINDKLKAEGKISLLDSNIKFDDKTFTGDIALNLTASSSAKNKIFTKGEMKVSKGLLLINENHFYKGDLSANNIFIEIKNNEVSAVGDITLNDSNIQLNKNLSLSGNILSPQLNFQFENNKIFLKGNFNSTGFELVNKDNVHIKGNLYLTDSEMYFHDSILESKGSVKTENFKMLLNGTDRLESELFIRNFYLKNSGEYAEINADVEMPALKAESKNIKISGAPELNIKYKYFYANNNFDYEGLVSLNNESIKGIKDLGEIKNIKGLINFKNDEFFTDNLTFNFNGADILGSGSLKNIKNPLLEIQAKTEITDVKIFDLFLHDYFDNFDIALTGNSSVDLKFKGMALKPLEGDIDISLLLKGVNLTSQNKYLNASGIKGYLRYQKDLVTWKNIQGVYKNKLYYSSGELESFTRPVVNLDMFSDDLKFTSRVRLLNNAFIITSLRGNYLGLTFDAKGDIHTFNDKEPDLDLRGSFSLPFENCEDISPEISEKIKNYNLKGTLKAEGLFRGKINDWKNWDLSLKGNIEKLSFMNYPFLNTSIEYNQRDKNVSKFNLTSQVYNGQLSIFSTHSLLEENIFSKINVELNGLNIEELRKDKKLQQNSMKGKLFLTANVQGHAGQMNKLKGHGSFSTKDAYLGEISIIKGLLSVINSIPGFLGNIIANLTSQSIQPAAESTVNYITDIKGDFFIENNQAHTQNTFIYGSLYDLIVNGSFSFNNNLNFMVTPDYSRFKNKYKNATEFMGSPVRVKIAGTLNEPNYKPIFDPIKPIQKAVGATLELLKGVGDVLSDILE